VASPFIQKARLKEIMKRFGLRSFLLLLAVSAAAAYVIHRLSGLNFLVLWGIVVAAMVLNGLIAEWEDRKR
jgi:hypothetical protein